MNLFLKGRTLKYEAIADYNLSTRKVIVKKGSIVAEKVAHSDTYNRNQKVSNLRKQVTKNNKTIKDIEFKSLSAAAGFVTGHSTNGLIRWKTEDGTTIKEYLKQI